MYCIGYKIPDKAENPWCIIGVEFDTEEDGLDKLDMIRAQGTGLIEYQLFKLTQVST